MLKVKKLFKIPKSILFHLTFLNFREISFIIEMPMPSVSNKNCLTLNHLFTVPSSHQRNFVRENKQFVREKSKQQHAKNHDIPIKNCATQCRAPFGSNSGRNSSRPDKVNGVPSIGTNSSNTQWRQRTQNIRTESGERLSPKNSKTMQRRYPISRMTKSKTETQSVAVQTDEIRDEVYLYTALKKCASPAFKSALKSKYLQKDDEIREKNQKQLPLNSDEQQFPPNEGPNLRSEINVHHYENKETQSSNTRNLYDKEKQNPPFGSTQNISRPNSQQSRRHFDETTAIRIANADVNDLFNVMSLPPDLQKKCQPNECSNCPDGYHLLTENDRYYIKKKLLERETLLIKQLNSFPLAIETLRVRQTKTRIEKELSVLEENLRKLTKKKIYVKISE